VEILPSNGTVLKRVDGYHQSVLKQDEVIRKVEVVKKVMDDMPEKSLPEDLPAWL
jgi:Ni,Fe-hydrogenase III large subunit